MKKLLLATAATAAFSYSAAAEEMFYVRGDVGAAMQPKQTVNIFKFKSKAGATAEVGVGYYLMDNLRVEAAIAKPFGVKSKANTTTAAVAAVPGGAAATPAFTRNAKLKINSTAFFVKAYVDVLDLSVAKVFVGGGLGLARTSAKASITSTAAAGTSEIYKFKNKNNLAFTVGLGAGFDVAEGVKLDVQYAFRDYGKSKSLKISTGDIISGVKSRSHNVLAGLRIDV